MTEDEIVEEVEDARRSLQGKCPLRIDEVIVQLFDERNEAIERVESLRAQVEELSKYPEGAVRAVFECGRLVEKRTPSGARHYKNHADRLAAIFKEKQGEGK